MISIGALVLAFAIAATGQKYNETNIDQQVLKRLNTIINATGNLDPRDIARLNRTAQSLGLDRDLVAKLSERLKNERDVKRKHDTNYNLYEDGTVNSEASRVDVVEESPDYASSVVLASDLLSLSSAVANVNEKVCREQGYRFLDGLLLNKRWALKSKF
ncbi:jg12880 [Pararge aegeria aegeria]|uniref:Jg12880 protein n=1 Tax=Pararge aegeria aegeria TaxID=348720 RepID=A0A8S4S215_9NEOP|nr:jg12880 [Pararge aegeria aegeria]